VIKSQLFIMLKEPNPGEVKTRLGKDIGMREAAWWFRDNALNLIKNLSAETTWATILAVSPDKEGMASRIWPNGLLRWPQGSGDLGERMGNIFRNAQKGPVVIIGADIPNIKVQYIKDAFDALDNNDVVIGPAYDGGYWLIGMKCGSKSISGTILKNVRWSTPFALNDTLNSLEGLKIKKIVQLRDVDTKEDLNFLRKISKE